jgi:hypothetical protein
VEAFLQEDIDHLMKDLVASLCLLFFGEGDTFWHD